MGRLKEIARGAVDPGGEKMLDILWQGFAGTHALLSICCAQAKTVFARCP